MSPRPARPIPRSRRAAAPVPGERLAGQVGEEVRLALHGAGRLRMPELLLFAALAVSGLPISAIPGGLENVIVAVICVLALLRRPVRELGPWQALVPVMVLTLAYIAVVSLTAEQGTEAADWRLRLLRISPVLVLLMVMGTGRLDVRSSVAGYAAAAVVNVPLFYVGAVPSTCGGFLTGFFGDKNVSGLVYCVIGLLTVYFVRRPGARVAIPGAFAAMVWLTGSRTAIAASLCALTWVLLARLPALLDALSAQQAPDQGTIEVLVVIDGAVDGSEGVVSDAADTASAHLEVRAVVLPRNRGRVGALNVGHAAARGDVLIRCDDDLLPAPDFVARHVAAHAGGEDVDYGYRLHAAGLEIALEPGLEAGHRAAAVTTAIRARRAHDAGRARHRFETLHPAAGLPAAIPLLSAWNLAVRAVSRLPGLPPAGAGLVDALLPRLPRPLGRKLVALWVEGAGVVGYRRACAQEGAALS